MIRRTGRATKPAASARSPAATSQPAQRGDHVGANATTPTNSIASAVRSPNSAPWWVIEIRRPLYRERPPLDLTAEGATRRRAGVRRDRRSLDALERGGPGFD